MDEIGFARAGSELIVTTAPGMLVLGLFLAAVTAFSVLLVAAPTANGQDPLWGALVLTIGGIAGWCTRCGWRCPVPGARGRRERSIPDPARAS